MQPVLTEQEFTFRLRGQGVTPRAFKARELGALITRLEHVFQYCLAVRSEADAENFYLSLVDVRSASLGLGMLPNSQSRQVFVAVFTAITTAISQGDFSAIPARAIKELQEVQKTVRAKGGVADFIYGGETFASLDSTTQIQTPASSWIRGETIIYGELKRVGGQDPTARIELDTGGSITCGVTRTIAKQLGSKLYAPVALKGMASWSAVDNNLLDFQIEQVLPYAPSTSNRASFDGLRALIGDYWDAVENVDAALLSDEPPIG